jgi:hypothetical protein
MKRFFALVASIALAWLRRARSLRRAQNWSRVEVAGKEFCKDQTTLITIPAWPYTDELGDRRSATATCLGHGPFLT